jgi:hypothetical protein
VFLTKNILRTSRCIAKDASQFGCSQYWGYTIPKTFLTPWVGNLISNFLIKLFTTLVKPHIYHGVINLGICLKINYIYMKRKDKMEKFYYLCIGFSLMI